MDTLGLLVAATLAASCRQVWSRGTEGMFEHCHAVALPWGFKPEQVAAPRTIWHGDGDREILPSMADDLARRMTNAQMYVERGRGHLLLFAEWDRILRSMVRPKRSRAAMATAP